MTLNLNKLPYPFEENQFEEILMLNIFEHLVQPIEVLEEIYRISKNNSRIIIDVPHFSSYCAWVDLTHVRPYSYFSFDYYKYSDKKAGNSLESKRSIKFEVNSYLNFNRLYRYLGISYLFNKFPKIYETFFAFIFPCGGIRFKLITKK
jgi:SAM-dependent methyltransferase